MKVNKVGNIQVNNILNKISKPVKKEISNVSVPVMITTSAISGLYTVNKALQTRKDFCNEIKNKDENFYSQIINNIKDIKKEENKNSSKYNLTLKNGHASMDVTDDKVYTVVETISDNVTFKTQRTLKKDLIKEVETKIIDGKTISTKITTNKLNKNTLENKITENNTENYQKIKYAPDGSVLEKTSATSDLSDSQNVKTKIHTIDYKHNSEIYAEKTGIKFDMNFENYLYHDLQKITKIIKNPNSDKKEIHSLEMSEIPNIYNSTIIDEDGNKISESVSHKNSDGTISIEKEYKSLDGTKTKYSYNADENKNNIKMNYIVFSKDGEILNSITRTFNRVSPKLAYSSVNNHKYTIETTDSAYVVTDENTGVKTEIKKDETLFWDKDSERNHEILDKISGEMLLDLHKRGYKFHYNRTEGGCSDAFERRLYVPDDVYLFAHEQGHTKDIVGEVDSDYNPELEKLNSTGVQHRLMNNPKFRNTYEEERKIFIENMSEMEANFISYFIDKTEHYLGVDGSACEMLANCNAMISTGLPYKNDNVAYHYLQKYFPKTIAEASKLLNNDVI